MFPVALVGASEKPSLSQKLFFRLQEVGFQVAPVNPNCTKLWEIACFPSLAAIPKKPEVVIFMVNPKLTLQILPQVVDLNIKKVWFQPGTFDDEVLAYCKEHQLSVEHEKCLLIAPPQVLKDFA